MRGSTFEDFLKFIRFKICIFETAMAISGYLFFNEPSLVIALVGAGAFFICAAVCAYNNITDVEEDLVNKKIVSPFARNNKVYYIMVGFFATGLIISFFLSWLSLAIYFMAAHSGFFYSFLRLKRFFLFKNLYCGFAWSMMFVYGSNAQILSFDLLVYYALISFFIFASSIISDLRDLKGDEAVGLKTLPVALGPESSKRVSYILYGMFLFSLAVLEIKEFFIFMPFCLMIMYFVGKNRLETAHSLSGTAFFVFALYLIL